MNPDFRDILSIFSAEKVEYLLVGAYALAAHGFPRATGDMDLWINATPENAQRVWQALARFGAPMNKATPEDFRSPELIFQIGVIPNRIDVITSVSGVSFADAWPKRKEVEIVGLKVWVIGLDDLIINKKAAGRPKDMLDADWLSQNRQKKSRKKRSS